MVLLLPAQPSADYRKAPVRSQGSHCHATIRAAHPKLKFNRQKIRFENFAFSSFNLVMRQLCCVSCVSPVVVFNYLTGVLWKGWINLFPRQLVPIFEKLLNFTILDFKPDFSMFWSFHHFQTSLGTHSFGHIWSFLFRLFSDADIKMAFNRTTGRSVNL